MVRETEIRVLVAGLMVVALCATLILRGMVQPAQTAPEARVSPPVISVLGDRPRTGEAARILRQMETEANFYAAFAFNPEGGFGWADNYATQAGADAAAMAWCREEGEGCEIILRIAPEQPADIDGQSLSKTAALAVGEYGGRPASKALALSDLGDWGMAWGRNNRLEAAEAAMAMCRARLDVEVPGAIETGACRVVLQD